VGSRSLSPVAVSRSGSPVGRSRADRGLALLQKRELARKEQSRILPRGSLPNNKCLCPIPYTLALYPVTYIICPIP